MINILHQNHNYLILKMKALRTFEMDVTIYQSTGRDIPKYLNLYQNRCEELRSRNVLQYFC